MLVSMGVQELTGTSHDGHPDRELRQFAEHGHWKLIDWGAETLLSAYENVATGGIGRQKEKKETEGGNSR